MRGRVGAGASKPVADLVLNGVRQCLTMAGGEGPARGDRQGGLGMIREAAIAVADGRLVYVGPASGLPASVRVAADARRVDVGGGVVLPGYVDPHTHLVFGGWRAEEFGLRVAGADYRQILEAGGGILATVEATRRATEDELVAVGVDRLRRMAASGTTTVEIKSGYGLSLAAEAKLLRVVGRLAGLGPWELVPTLLGAHAVPPEYRDDREAYVELVEEMIDVLGDRAEYVDVFCEEGAFDVDESRRILRRAEAAGLGRKLHADQLSDGGGAALAAEVGATSADHLDRASPEGIEALAAAKVIAVLLPSVPLYVHAGSQAPAAALRDAGVPLALATDFNPGTSPIESMGTVVALACLLLRMTPAEALVAATRNAAWAVGRGDRVGRLEVGLQADLQAYRIDDYRQIPYRFGQLLPEVVVKSGEVVARRGAWAADG